MVFLIEVFLWEVFSIKAYLRESLIRDFYKKLYKRSVKVFFKILSNT